LYAPFYIWHSHDAANRFLLDDLFKGVIDTFSRPRVRNWNILAAEYGDNDIVPTYAVRETDVIAPEETLNTLMRREKGRMSSLLVKPGLYFQTLALDADRWELMRYTLWKDEKSAELPESDCIQTYEVLHVS